MTKTAERLLKDALALGPRARAELAAELLASLDGETEERVEDAWAREIEGRAERARAGTDTGRPWPEVRKRLRRKLREQ